VDEFKGRIDAGDFVEWEEVYPGRYYGTLREELERIWSEGHHAIFDIDVIGGLDLKEGAFTNRDATRRPNPSTGRRTPRSAVSWAAATRTSRAR
jgi:hypothetical protein